MAHKVPKDIDLIIYRFIHRDLTKLVNQEYHKKVKACTCKEYYDCKNDICYSCIHVKLRYVVAFNYRS